MPREDRIVQTFGWQPVAWGVLLLVGSGYVAYQPSPEAARAGNYAFCAALAFGALLLIVYEWWRRSRPIVLTPGGDSVGVYRRDRLEVAVPVERVVTYRRHPANTFGVLIALTPFPVFGVFVAVFVPHDLALFERVMIFVAAASVGGIMGSLVWSRLFCEQLVLPGQSRFGHSVLVRRRDYPRVFRAALPPDTAGR